MLIQQVIEFELRGPGPPGLTKFNTQMQDFKRVLNLKCKYMED